MTEKLMCNNHKWFYEKKYGCPVCANSVEGKQLIKETWDKLISLVDKKYLNQSEWGWILAQYWNTHDMYLDPPGGTLGSNATPYAIAIRAFSGSELIGEYNLRNGTCWYLNASREKSIKGS